MTPDADGRFRGIVVGRLWPGHRDYAPPVDDATGGRTPPVVSCGVEVDAIPCFSGCACTCGTDCPCECHPNNKEDE